MSNSKFNQGVYTLINKSKYIGKTAPVFRSNWESIFMRYCDNNPKILKWGSECVVIPYYDPVKQTQRKYFMDFIIIGESGKTTLVEIKPYKQTRPPINSKKKTKKTFLYESTTFATNDAKWKAAKEFCDKRKWDFKIITEKVFKF